MKKSVLKVLCFFIPFLIFFQSLFVYGNGASPYTADTEVLNLSNALKNIHPENPCTLRIMSYNLLADTPPFYGSPAYSRANEVCCILNALLPDVIGLQEASRNWIYSLSQGTDYTLVSPIKTNLLGTMTAIIYNKESVLLTDWGEYVFEKTYNSKLRCAVWGVFKEKSTAKSFIVINTHLSLSHNETDTPIQQATEILALGEKLYTQYDCPVFFTGDFNSGQRFTENNPASCVYETLCTCLTDTLKEAVQKSDGENLSINAHSVDHIFLKGEACIEGYAVLSQKPMKELSDHYPIFIDVLL